MMGSSSPENFSVLVLASDLGVDARPFLSQSASQGNQNDESWHDCPPYLDEDFSDLEALQFFRLEAASDKAGNRIVRRVGKYFPGFNSEWSCHGRRSRGSYPWSIPSCYREIDGVGKRIANQRDRIVKKLYQTTMELKSEKAYGKEQIRLAEITSLMFDFSIIVLIGSLLRGLWHWCAPAVGFLSSGILYLHLHSPPI